MEPDNHQALIAMCQDLKKILEAAEIQFFLIGGSAIGAVRHQGMIPWDDDIDVGIKREQIPAFVAAFAASPLARPYHLVIPGQEPDYYFPTYKVLDQRGPLADNVDAGTGLRGAFIDIFPLDKTFAWKPLRRVHQLQVRLDQVALDIARGDEATGNHLGPFRRWSVRQAARHTPTQLAARYCHDIAKFAGLRHGYLFYNFGSPYAWDREMYRRDEVAAAVPAVFEQEDFPIAQGYDAILTRMYGDYMTPPPASARQPKHIQS
ncbi:LicD family protein [Lapidilactobacillus salsurivasis]